MHQDLDSILSILNQIKHYYSITQKFVEMHPIRRRISISKEIISEATDKLNTFECEKQQYIIHINASMERSNYSSRLYRPSHQVLENNIAPLAQCASDLYQYLIKVHTELNKSALDNNDDFKEIVSSVLTTTQTFDLTLGQLSDYMLNKGAISPAFSLARHTERLPFLYQESYEKTYNRYGFFSFGLLYAFKLCCRTSSRIDDINFLSQKLSTHPLCDDQMRFTAFSVLIRRITDAYARGSLLKAILQKGLDCSMATINDYDEIFVTLNDFCHKNHIFFPDDLQCYINKRLQTSESISLII